MARTPASVAASRIRIEDEVWEEAFSSRVPARQRRMSGPAAPAGVMSADRPFTGTVTLRVAPEVPVLELDPPEPRRTIRIQGRGSDPFRSDPYARARSAHRPSPPRTVGASPDRLAMWATLLGFLLVLVAILSSHF